MPTPDSRRSLRQAAYPQLPEAPTTPTPRPGTRPPGLPVQPGVRRLVAPDGPVDDSHGARDHEALEIALAHLRYPAEPQFASSILSSRSASAFSSRTKTRPGDPGSWARASNESVRAVETGRTEDRPDQNSCTARTTSSRAMISRSRWKWKVSILRFRPHRRAAVRVVVPATKCAIKRSCSLTTSKLGCLGQPRFLFPESLGYDVKCPLIAPPLAISDATTSKAGCNRTLAAVPRPGTPPVYDSPKTLAVFGV